MEPFDFSTFPILTTVRLVLREMVPGDAEDILIFRGDPEVERWNTWSTNVLKDAAQACAWVEREATLFAGQDRITWGITLRGKDQVMGFINLGYAGPREKRERVANMGYMLARAWWGQGITTEAVCAVVTFAFERLNIHRLGISTRADNLASVRLLEKLQIPPEGIIRESMLGEDGRYISWAHFGLLEQEYPRWAEIFHHPYNQAV